MPHQTLKERFFIKIHARPIGIPFPTSGSPCIQIKCGSTRHLKGHGGDSPMVEIDDVNSGVGELRRGVEANEIHGCLYVVTVANLRTLDLHCPLPMKLMP